jgi:enoyl-[acyl-carrier protein] reductase II
MAWVSTAPLVAAVSNAGAIGILGVGFAPLEFARAQVIETQKLTDKPFGINVVLVPEILDRVTEIIQETHVPVVYADTLDANTHGIAAQYFTKWHALGAKIIVKVGDVQGAKILEKAGADIIVAKGWEGGGHITFEATTVLVPVVKAAVSIPVVASGGIADGRGMAAAIALGADGIEMGSAFMVANETAIHPNAKQAILDATDMQNVVTGASTGQPCRQLKNKLSDQLEQLESAEPRELAAPKVQALAGQSLKLAMTDGDVNDRGAVMVGQIAPLLNHERPAHTIIDDTLSECHTILRQAATFSY